MEQRLSIVTLGVQDLKQAEDFYINIFGWTKSETSNDNITFIHLNGMFLSLYTAKELAKDANITINTSLGKETFKGSTLAYCAQSEKEVDTLFTHFKQNNVTVVKEAEKAFWGGYSGYISDPDGHLWEIAYNPFLKFDDKGNIV